MAATYRHHLLRDNPAEEEALVWSGSYSKLIKIRQSRDLLRRNINCCAQGTDTRPHHRRRTCCARIRLMGESETQINPEVRHSDAFHHTVYTADFFPSSITANSTRNIQPAFCFALYKIGTIVTGAVHPARQKRGSIHRKHHKPNIGDAVVLQVLYLNRQL